MLVDAPSRCIYVFGGKIVQPTEEGSSFSGLYRYSIVDRAWTLLLYAIARRSKLTRQRRS